EQAGGAAGRRGSDQPRFTQVCRRHDDVARLARRVRGGQQHAANGPEFSREAEFAVELAAVQQAFGERHLRGGEQDAERDRQVIAAAFLGQVRWRKIDRDASGRIFEARVLQRSAHAVLALFHRGGRQANDGELRQAAAEVHFDFHARRGEAELRAARDPGYSHVVHTAMTPPWAWRIRLPCRGLRCQRPAEPVSFASSSVTRFSSSSSRARVRSSTLRCASNSSRPARSSLPRLARSTARKLFSRSSRNPEAPETSPGGRPCIRLRSISSTLDISTGGSPNNLIVPRPFLWRGPSWRPNFVRFPGRGAFFRVAAGPIAVPGAGMESALPAQARS